MELFSAPDKLDDFLRRSESVERDGVLRVTRPEEFRAEVIDSLVWTAVFGQPSVRDAARRAIRQAAASVGILPASILPLYKARGREECGGGAVAQGHEGVDAGTVRPRPGRRANSAAAR